MASSSISYELDFKQDAPSLKLSDGVETYTIKLQNLPSAWSKFFTSETDPVSSVYGFDVLHKAFLWARSKKEVDSPFVPFVYKDLVLSLNMPKHLKKDKILYNNWISFQIRNKVKAYEPEAFDWIDLVAQATEFCDNEPLAFSNLWKKLKIVGGKLVISSAFRVEGEAAISCGQLTLGSLLQSNTVATLECLLENLDASVLRSNDAGVFLSDTSLLQSTSAQIETARARLQSLYEQTSRPLIPANMQLTTLDTMNASTLELEESNAHTPIYQLLFAA